VVNLEFKEILRFGISENYLKVCLSRFRNNKSKSWQNFKDPLDKRKVLINIDTIPESTRLKYNIPSAQEYAEQKLIEQENKLRIETETRYNLEKSALIEAYTNEWIPYVNLYDRLFSYSRKTQIRYSKQFAKEHAFWVKMVEITGTKYSAYHGKVFAGFQLFSELKNQLSFYNSINNLNYFTRKLKEIRTAIANNQDLSELIADGNLKRKPHLVKTTDFHNALTLSFLSHPKKYPYRVVTDLVNHHCQIEEMPPITESWIKKKMAEDNKFRSAVSKYRNGEKYFNDNLLAHAVRNVTPYPANVWMIDGTPIQFFCWNETRTKVIRLNLFAIIDVCTRKIVGFDMAYSEDRFNILKALKLAVLSEGHLPAEIVSDNFSANKTEEIKDIKTQMENMGVNWRFSRLNNPQDKSYIERFFGAFQSVECALYDDYIGEGITSKRLNARPSREYLEEVAKKKGYPTFNEMKDRIGLMIAKYNERELSKTQSPNEKYKSLPKPNMVEMDATKTALMFWNKTTYTVKRGMVKITVRKVEHSYEIYNHDLKMYLQNKKVLVRYDENELDRVILFDEFDKVICEVQKSVRVSVSKIDETEQTKDNTYKVVAKNKSYSNHIDKYRNEIISKGLESVGKETLELVHPLSLAKNQINSIESKQLLELYRYQNEIPKDVSEPIEYKPIGIIAKNPIESYENITQKKSPTKKGSLKVIGKPNN
jgi:transposase InsO family protein